MNEEEKLRLVEEYKFLSNDEILDLLSTNKSEFDEGVYDLIVQEAKRRNIPDKAKATKENNPADIVADPNQRADKACPNCLTENDENVDFCKKCGSPIGTYTHLDPMKRIGAMGHLYRSSTSKPVPFITLCGFWLLFGCSFIGSVFLFILFWTSDAWLLSLILPLPLMIIIGVFLYKVTRKHILYREKLKNS